MVEVVARNWGLVVLRGVAALLFGLLTFFVPAISLIALITVFGAYALVDGLFTIVAAVRDRRGQPQWVAFLLGGLLSVVAGILTFVMPGMTALVLLYIIAAWAIASGIAEIVAAIRLRKEIRGEWMLIVAGLLSIAFGAVLFANPGTGALAVTIWIGIYAFVLGIMLIALGFRLRSWTRHFGQATPTPA